MGEFFSQVSWPGAALILGSLALLLLLPQWRSLLSRTKKLGTTGWEGHEPQQLAATKPSSGVDEYLDAFQNGLVLQQEQRILTDLRERAIEEPVGRERALVKTLAAYQIAYHFERLYGTIYASQIALLVHLNARADGESEANLRPFYDQAVERFPTLYENDSFERYLGFLEASLLVQRANDRVQVSLTGREFLKYIVDARKLIPTVG